MVENIKWVFKNIVIGLILVYVVNFIGVHFGINIPINIVSILVAGFLRIPGIAILIVLSKI